MTMKNTSYQSIAELPIKTSLISRNITVLGRRTSVRLEPEMWSALHDIARREQCTVHDLCSLISIRKVSNSSLTAAIRVFLMLYFRAACTEEGHRKAGHGNFEFMKQRARVDISMPVSKMRTTSDKVAPFEADEAVPALQANGGQF